MNQQTKCDPRQTRQSNFQTEKKCQNLYKNSQFEVKVEPKILHSVKIIIKDGKQDGLDLNRKELK